LCVEANLTPKPKKKKYLCFKCKAPLEACPPDDVHIVAARSEKDFKDNIKVEYQCSKCQEKNIIYWGALGPIRRLDLMFRALYAISLLAMVYTGYQFFVATGSENTYVIGLISIYFLGFLTALSVPCRILTSPINREKCSMFIMGAVALASCYHIYRLLPYYGQLTLCDLAGFIPLAIVVVYSGWKSGKGIIGVLKRTDVDHPQP